MLPLGQDIVLLETRRRNLVGGLLRLVRLIGGSLHRSWLKMRCPFVPFREVTLCLPFYGRGEKVGKRWIVLLSIFPWTLDNCLQIALLPDTTTYDFRYKSTCPRYLYPILPAVLRGALP